jgi:hypothetical protein
MTDPDPGAAPPQFWTASTEVSGRVLTYAVRSGKGFYFLLVAGAVAFAYCASVLVRWLSEGELTGPGVVFLLLPVAGMVFGAHCLDLALRAQSRYVLEGDALDFSRRALFGARSRRVPRAAIEEIFQQWSPPGSSAPSGSPGTWATLVRFRVEGAKKPKELALDGLGTPVEAAWLGPQLAAWAKAPLRKSVAASAVEAGEDDLPPELKAR